MDDTATVKSQDEVENVTNSARYREYNHHEYDEQFDHAQSDYDDWYDDEEYTGTPLEGLGLYNDIDLEMVNSWTWEDRASSARTSLPFSQPVSLHIQLRRGSLDDLLDGTDVDAFGNMSLDRGRNTQRIQSVVLPSPFSKLSVDCFHVHGLPIYSRTYVDGQPQRLFTKYKFWFLEMDDALFLRICPSDLNDMPCEWDELPGGCPLLRLCQMQRKFPHPYRAGPLECPPSSGTTMGQTEHCAALHGISPTCRGITGQLRFPYHEQFRSVQLCAWVANDQHCAWGHDFESARSRACYRYWDHRTAARDRGSTGIVKKDCQGQVIAWKPICPLEMRRKGDPGYYPS